MRHLIKCEQKRVGGREERKDQVRLQRGQRKTGRKMGIEKESQLWKKVSFNVNNA